MHIKQICASVSMWTLTPFTVFPLPLFLGAESPVNNHYLLNRLPFPSTVCREGAQRGRNNYHGLFFLYLQDGSQETNWERTWQSPHFLQVPQHIRGGEVHPHSIMHAHCIKRKGWVSFFSSSTFFRIDIYFCGIQSMFAHTLPVLHPSIKLEVHLLRSSKKAPEKNVLSIKK